MTVPTPSLGTVIALVVLVLAIGVMAFDLHHFTWPLALVAALAVARLT